MVKIKSGFTGERAIVIPSSIIEKYKKTVLGSLLHITDIGFYPKATFHFRKRTKQEVSQYVLIYCIEGTGWFETNNQIQNIIANQIFILPKDEAHSYGCNSKKPWTIYWIHFDGKKAPFFAESFSKPLLIFPEKDSRIEDRLKLFEEIILTLKNGYSKSNLDFSVTSLFYLLGSLKFLGLYRASNNIQQKKLQNNIVEDAIHFMRENIRKQIKLKEIAQYVGLSPSRFSVIFQQRTGQSPLKYLIHLKIQESCHLLDFSEMKINQICMLVGFEDPLYFSRIFSKIMGCSPSDYRKKKKG